MLNPGTIKNDPSQTGRISTPRPTPASFAGSVFAIIGLLAVVFGLGYIAFSFGGWIAASLFAALVLAGAVSEFKWGRKAVLPFLKIGGTTVFGWLLAKQLLPIESVARLLGALVILAVYVFVLSCLFDHKWLDR